MSSNDVTITEHPSGEWRLQSPWTGAAYFSLRADEVDALRARFAAERMPEDVQKLVAEAREVYGSGLLAPLDYGVLTAATRSLIIRLTAALEAAYSKGAE